MYRLVLRPPTLSLFSDASGVAVGGYCLESALWWRYDLSDAEHANVKGSTVHSEDDISINVLELLGMVLSAWVVFILGGHRPRRPADCVLLRGDNSSAVTWVNKCRGGKEPRSGALMRMLGLLEIDSGWVFEAKHVPGILNDVADGISRWPLKDVSSNLLSRRPDVRWQMQDLGSEGRHLCSCILAAGSSEMPLRRRLRELAKDILGRGFSSGAR